MMKAILGRSKAIRGLRDDLRLFRRHYLSARKAAIGRYLSNAKVPALHIGANRSHLPGWLETDIEPMDAETVYLDASKPFPLPSSAFDYVYCEHMIEHVPHAAGLFMLRECRRVLRPTGVARIATPDLSFILGLHDKPGPDGERYIRWVAEKFLGAWPGPIGASTVINNSFRAWGHQFLYDAETLQSALRATGFKDVVRVDYNDSKHEALRNIERHGINVGNVEMTILETMIYEAS